MEFSKNKPVLIIGMSHTRAITSAINPDEDQKTLIINLHNKLELWDPRNRELNLDSFGDLKPEKIITSIDGNYHNIMGLIENPIPFSVGQDGLGHVPANANRHFIPFDMMAEHFKRHLSASLSLFGILQKKFPSVPMSQICSPPPIPDNNFIRQNPSVFGRDMHKGITPKNLRLYLYHMHSWIFERFCEERDIGFISPPPGAVEESGFLAKPYWHDDPTHANEAYGRLVLDQLTAYDWVKHD